MLIYLESALFKHLLKLLPSINNQQFLGPVHMLMEDMSARQQILAEEQTITIKRQQTRCSLAFFYSPFDSKNLGNNHLLNRKGELVNLVKNFVINANSRNLFSMEFKGDIF